MPRLHRRTALKVAAVAALGVTGSGAAAAWLISDRRTTSATPQLQVRDWLSGYAGDTTSAGRDAWTSRYSAPQVATTYMDYESNWAQRATDVGLNRRNFLPPVSDGSSLNVLTIGLTLCGPDGSTAMNNAGLAAAADGTDASFAPGFTGIGRAIRAAGLDSPSTVIRLGHEMDSNWYPWATDNQPQAAADYIRAWRRAHSAIRAVCPTVRFDECYNTGGSPSLLDLHYVGDDYVDIVSTDFYDFSEARSASEVVTEQHGAGIAEIGEFAHAHGKKFALDEWGVNGNNASAANRDNPVYILWIFDQLAALEGRHPGIVSHDSYFDEKPYYLLDENPRAAAAYRRLWKPPSSGPASLLSRATASAAG